MTVVLLKRDNVMFRNHMLARFYLSVYPCMRFTYSRSPLNLLHPSTCSHDYSDTSVIVTQPDSINSYPG
jgi:hypothetical protein